LSDNNNLKIETSLNINDNFEIVKNTTMRKTIAERLVKSKNEAPHFYLSLDCNL
jgi:pyruvate/2-oxoglutarate dehydrogenase complex dihydrolipoamide acyltransferase (E2) component